MSGRLRVFVYGTLRRGFWNHEPYLGGLGAPATAKVRGHLWVQPSGSPVVKVPPGDVRALATGDLQADLALQERPRLEALPALVLPWERHAPWGAVHGELYELDPDPERLARLDALEGFVPGGESTYLRVLVPVVRGDRTTALAWIYVAEPWQGSASFLEDGVYKGRP